MKEKLINYYKYIFSGELSEDDIAYLESIPELEYFRILNFNYLAKEGNLLQEIVLNLIRKQKLIEFATLGEKRITRVYINNYKLLNQRGDFVKALQTFGSPEMDNVKVK